MIDKIKRLPLRKVWKHEAWNFTTWLEQNIDVLEEIVGFEISNPEREKSTGNFNVDIKAENSSGETIVIENQLEKSNHDHLGKIITYLAAFEKTVAAIWIVSEPRQEHIDAISWLNTGSNECNFYLLKIEAIQIGESKPAPLLTKIVGPSEEARQIGKIKKEDSERHRLRLAFWHNVLESTIKKHDLFNSVSPNKNTILQTNSHRKGVKFAFTANSICIGVELRIDLGKDSEEENLRLFNLLKSQRNDIELSFGETLEWNEAISYRVCIIRKQLNTGGYGNPEIEWNGIVDECTDMMLKLEKAFIPFIKKLK